MSANNCKWGSIKTCVDGCLKGRPGMPAACPQQLVTNVVHVNMRSVSSRLRLFEQCGALQVILTCNWWLAGIQV